MRVYWHHGNEYNTWKTMSSKTSFNKQRASTEYSNYVFNFTSRSILPSQDTSTSANETT